MKRIIKQLLLALAAGLALPATLATAQPVTVLHSFGGPNDGRNPAGSLLLSGSTAYGMTAVGPGLASFGTIFRMATDGTGYTTMHSFAGGLNDGDTPNGSLIQSGSTLYGMTQFGGSASAHGTIFKIGTDGSNFGLIHSFTGGPTDGANPLGSLVISGNTFYGMTSSGGNIPTNTGLYQNGTIFKTNVDGTGYAVLHNFAGGPSDGSGPHYGALVVSGGAVYGMTIIGGSGFDGTIFKMGLDGTGYSILHTFLSGAGDGAAPPGQLLLSGSTLYGMTGNGGGANLGTIFKMGIDGTSFTLMHSFTGGASDGYGPQGTLTESGPSLYGMTPTGGPNSLGTILGVGTGGTGYGVLHDFGGGTGDGAFPNGDLTLSGSNFYGMTVQGGMFNQGTVFSFTPIPEPSSFYFVAFGGLATAVVRQVPRRRAVSCRPSQTCHRRGRFWATSCEST